jgi:cell division protein FtsB
MSGARGAFSWMKLSKEVISLEKELDELLKENAFLEHKIKLIQNNIDLDLLEEQAYGVIGFSKENDIIVLLPKEES